MYRCLALTAFLAAAAYAGDFAYDHDKIVSCYYSSWAYYRPGIGKFDVDDIDPSVCTHGFYGFADLNNATWEIDAIDINFDLCPEQCPEGEVCQYCGFQRFTDIKNEWPHFKPMLSIGGWNAGSAEYSQMAKDPDAMQTFVDSVVPYLEKYGFVGLDLDWEYPGSREGADADVDKDNFVKLTSMLSEELHDADMLFTMAIAAGYRTADLAYDVAAIKDHFDFFNVMTYDYHGYFPPDETFLGHNAPLRTYEMEQDPSHPGYKASYHDIVEYYRSEGLPLDKMVLGVPTYGRGFTLGKANYDDDDDDSDDRDEADEDGYDRGYYCPSERGLPMGPYTRQSGHYGYLEVQQLFDNDTYLFMPEAESHGWERIWDECYKAPHLVNGPYWLGYDDIESVQYKTRYANYLGAAGMMVWSIETDDFGAFYSDVSYPLLRTINEELAAGTTYEVGDNDDECEGSPEDFCDLLEDLAESCTVEDNGQKLPYPGNCHWYYYCILVDPDDDEYEIEQFDCDEKIFDPIQQNCVDPNLPASANLCGSLN